MSSASAMAGNMLTLAGDPCSVPLAQKLAEAYNIKNAAFNTVIAKSPIVLVVNRSNPVTHTNIMVAGNEGAIGQQIYGYESDDVKVLTIDGVLPDEKTVPTQYAFYQDYNIVTHGKPDGLIRDYINFAFSDEGKTVIRAMRHIPLN